MAFILAIFMLLSQAAFTGIPSPAQTVQGNIDYRQTYIEQGVLPSAPPVKQPNRRRRVQ